MATAKVKIDRKAGIVELEGESEFVERYLDKLMPLLDGSDRETGSAADGAGDEGAEADDQRKGTAKKRRVQTTPKGAGCRDRMLVLRNDGFFAQHRTPVEIVAGLAKKGWTHKSNQVSAGLTTMFEKSEIQRTSEGDGYRYYWDR